MMNSQPIQRNSWLTPVAGLLAVGIYAFVYWEKPFSQEVNQFILGSLTVLASAIVSIIATRIYRIHPAGDPPRAVWLNFAIGFWLWTIAEFLWFLRGLALGNVGGTATSLTPAHLFWFVAYFFFSAALYLQHRIIAGPRRARGPWIIVVIWVLVILLSWATMLAIGDQLDFLTFVQYFFGYADLAVGVVGLTMLLAFSGGALAWPWWGFVGLAVSNILYEVLDAGMMAAVSAQTTSVLELLSELTYLAAYLVLAIGFQRYYLLLQYGPQGGPVASRPAG